MARDQWVSCPFPYLTCLILHQCKAFVKHYQETLCKYLKITFCWYKALHRGTGDRNNPYGCILLFIIHEGLLVHLEMFFAGFAASPHMPVWFVFLFHIFSSVTVSCADLKAKIEIRTKRHHRLNVFMYSSFQEEFDSCPPSLLWDKAF